MAVCVEENFSVKPISWWVLMVEVICTEIPALWRRVTDHPMCNDWSAKDDQRGSKDWIEKQKEE